MGISEYIKNLFFGTAKGIYTKMSDIISAMCTACRPICNTCKPKGNAMMATSEITEKFELIAIDLSLLQERILKMSLNLDVLAAEVARTKTVQDSAITLLKNLTVELERISTELAAKANEVPPVMDPAPLNNLIDKLKDSTDALATAVSDSSGVTPMKTVVLNADDPTKATVSVTMPEVLPEVVKVEAEVIVDKVDPASSEPQVEVTVSPATEAVVTADAPVVTDVIKTDEGLVDVIVAAPAEVHEEVKTEAAVDVVEAVKEAFEAAPEVTAEPVSDTPAPAVEAPAAEAPAETTVVLNADDPTVPTVSVTMPEVLPEVVKVDAEVIVDKVDPASSEPQVEITVVPAAAAEVIADKTATTDVIKTDEGQVDVVVTASAAVVDEVKTEAKVDVVEAVKEAFEAAPEVTAVLEAPAPVAEEPKA